MRVDQLLADIDSHVADNDHFEFFYIPHTGWALTKRNNRTTDPRAPRPRWKQWWDQIALENYAFGAVCRVGRRRVRAAVGVFPAWARSNRWARSASSS